MRVTGKVKWFDENRGCGIIKDSSGREIPVHYSDIEGVGYRSLSEGECVQFEITKSSGSFRAEHVRRLDAEDA